MHRVGCRRPEIGLDLQLPELTVDPVAQTREVSLERLRDMRRVICPATCLPWLPTHRGEVDESFRGDPVPVEIAANGPSLQAAVTQVAEQGLVDRVLELNAVFADSLLLT